MKTTAMTAEERVRYMTQAPVRRLILEMSAPTVILCTMLLQTIGMAWQASVVAAARQGLFLIPVVFILPNLLGQYRIILSADTASEVRQMPSQKLDAAKVSAASGGNSEPKQGQRSQSARDFCPRSTMRVPQPDIIEHFGNADAVPQLPERCLSRKAGIVRCCL